MSDDVAFTSIPDFEKAIRLKLRFDSPKGQLTVEDLFDLPLTSTSGSSRANLDSIAIALHRASREAAETISFVTPSENDESAELQLKFSIVKHVIDVKLAERDRAKEAADRKEKKQRLLALIGQKQDEVLASKPVEELIAMVESL